MKLPLLLITFLFCGKLFAQTTRVTREDNDRGIKEKYYVLKSDKQTREGKYEAYSLFGDRLLYDGYYKNGLPDSSWRYYSYGGKIVCQGKYISGKRTGMWYASNYQGEAEVQYDYTESKLVFYKSTHKSSDTAVKRNVINGTDTIKAVLDRDPIYLDGSGKMGIPIMTSMHYPIKAKENHVQGKVLIAITIGTDGNITNYRVKRSVGSGCDEEAMKAIKRVEGQWLPGMLNGKAVASEYDIPLSFSLSE